MTFGDAVEAMAIPIAEASTRKTWEAIGEPGREQWRLRARAALRAQRDMGLLLLAGVPEEGPPAEAANSEYWRGVYQGRAACRADVLARVVEVPPADE